MIDELMSRMDNIMKEIASNHDAVVEFDNTIEKLAHDIADLVEMWNKRENENHLLLVKILQSITKLLPPEDRPPGIDVI